MLSMIAWEALNDAKVITNVLPKIRDSEEVLQYSSHLRRACSWLSFGVELDCKYANPRDPEDINTATSAILSASSVLLALSEDPEVKKNARDIHQYAVNLRGKYRLEMLMRIAKEEMRRKMDDNNESDGWDNDDDDGDGPIIPAPSDPESSLPEPTQPARELAQ